MSNIEAAGLPGIFSQEGPDGSRVLHRRKKTAPGPASLEELRHMAGLQRRELLEAGLDVDLLINESLVRPPEPFFIGAAHDLFLAYPSIRLEGGGASPFFEEVRARGYDSLDALPLQTNLMTVIEPGSLAAQPDAKAAHALVEPRLLSAETWAVFASLMGAEYPEAALDAAWRQVLYWSAPDRLGLAGEARTYVDALCGYREAAAFSGEVLEKALGYIASQADTARLAPPGVDGVQSLVVFNSAPWPRTDYCQAELVLEDVPGLRLLDDAGEAVPFLADRGGAGEGAFLAQGAGPFCGPRFAGVGISHVLSRAGRPSAIAVDAGRRANRE